MNFRRNRKGDISIAAISLGSMLLNSFAAEQRSSAMVIPTRSWSSATAKTTEQKMQQAREQADKARKEAAIQKRMRKAALKASLKASFATK